MKNNSISIARLKTLNKQAPPTMQISKHGGPDGYENFWKLLSPKVSESLQRFANISSTFQRRLSHLRFTGRYIDTELLVFLN